MKWRQCEGRANHNVADGRCPHPLRHRRGTDETEHEMERIKFPNQILYATLTVHGTTVLVLLTERTENLLN